MAKTKKNELEMIHEQGVKRFAIIQNKEREQRKLAIEDMKFVNASDGQWSEEATEKRADRPRYTINRVAGAVDQLVGDQRQNRTSIKVRPASGAATDDIAKVFDGLIRNIESRSKAANFYDAAYDEIATGGYGGFRILTEFNDDDSFDQDIKIKGIPSAASSLWFDCSATEYDKRDATHAFVTSTMQLEAFKDKYPNATVTNFAQEKYSSGDCKEWFSDNEVVVAEYWVKNPVIINLALLSDGRIINKDEEEAVLDEIAGTGAKIIKERQAESFKVVHYKMNGAEILEGPLDWAGKYIPLIPVFGKIATIENKTIVRGVTRFAKDPQRIYNYTTSAAVEASALTPKDPYWITAKQAIGHEEQFKTFNVKNQPFMFFNTDPEAPGAPQRTGAPSVQTALISQVQQAAADIESTTQIFAPALGNAPQLLSEKSVASQAEKGDRGAFVYKDNLQKSIQYAGDILVDLLPRIMDTPRMERILGIDGKSEMIGLNQEALDDFNQPIKDEQTGEVVIVNDLSQGKYETTIETGKAFTTMQQESASQLIELMSVPAFEGVTADLIAKNLPILESDELSMRVRKNMIQQGIVEPTEEEIKELGLDQEQPEDPNAVALRENIQIQTEDIISQIEKREEETKKLIAQTQGETVSTLKTMMDAFKVQLDAGIPLSAEQADLKNNQEGIIEIVQDELPEQ